MADEYVDMEYLSLHGYIRNTPSDTEVHAGHQLRVDRGTCPAERIYQFSSVTQSCPTLRPHESQHAGPPCPSPTPGVHSNSRPLSQ